MKRHDNPASNEAGVEPPVSASVNRRHFLFIASYSLGIGLMVIGRFNGINDVIHPFLQMAVDPALYTQSPSFAHSLVPDSSFVFRFISHFRIDLTHPIFILPIYLLCCLLSAIAVDRITRYVFEISEPLLRTFILFATLFADGKLINLNKSSWILDHNFSFTFLAASLRLWFIYFYLRGRMAAMTLVLTPINILSFKIGWPITLMALALLMWRRDKSPLSWGALALSLVAPAIAALQAPIAMSASEAAQVFDILKTIHASEDNPFAGLMLQLLIFPIGCIWAWHAVAGHPANIRDSLRIAVVIALLIFVIGGIVLSVDAFPLKLPLVVLLSPARALETASFLIYLLALLRVLAASVLTTPQRCAILLSLITFKLTPSYMWVGCALAFLILATFLSWPRIARWNRRVDPSAATIAIAIMAPIAGAFFAFNLAGNRAQIGYDPILGYYDRRISADAVDMLRSVARERPDRLVIFAVDGQPGADADWNILARKSGIEGDPYYLPRLNDIKRQLADNDLHYNAQAKIAIGHVDLVLSKALAQRGISLVVPTRSVGALSDWNVDRHYGRWLEISAPRR